MQGTSKLTVCVTCYVLLPASPPVFDKYLEGWTGKEASSLVSSFPIYNRFCDNLKMVASCYEG